MNNINEEGVRFILVYLKDQNYLRDGSGQE